MTRDEALAELRQKYAEGYTGVYATKDDNVHYVRDIRQGALPDDWLWASVLPVDPSTQRVLVTWLQESRTRNPQALGGTE